MPSGGQGPAEFPGRLPVVPTALNVMSHAQTGCHPIRLVLPPKSENRLGDYWAHNGHAIQVKQFVNGSPFLRTPLTEVRSPHAGIDENPLLHDGSSVTSEN